MDIQEFFHSCKKGDITRVKYLCEEKDIDVNLRDKWDSTPLYYACLCGHHHIVEYLLHRGAMCDANTFDGERCVYGALTNQIRKLLLEHRMLTSSTMRREPYTEFLRRLFEDETYNDITFSIHGVKISAHRCILSTRSHFFTQQLETRWKTKKNVILNKKEISPLAFRYILEWMYTGQTTVDIKEYESTLTLVHYCQLTYLEEELQKAYTKSESYVTSKRGAQITSLYIHSPQSQWDLQQDMGVLAQQALPLEFRSWNGGDELPCLPRVEHQYVDVFFQVNEFKFYAHKPILFARSEYFRALVEDHFCEYEEDDISNIPVINIRHVSPQVFGDVLVFVYTNTCTCTEENIQELMSVAEMFLLPGLKRECGNWLIRYIDADTVLPILRSSRLYSLPRLEDACTAYIADNIEQFVGNEDLNELVIEDAKSVKERQETDSIPVIDDIRSHIRLGVRTLADVAEAEIKIQFLESILENLGLDA